MYKGKITWYLNYCEQILALKMINLLREQGSARRYKAGGSYFG